jgi:NADH-quinone oxidoreductase subunit J
MTLQAILSGQGLMFLFFAVAAIASGLLVVILQNPLRAALSLVINLFSVAGLYLSLNAYFLATVQVIVYAGAIMVLFLFVIMLLNMGQANLNTSYRGVRTVIAFASAFGLGGLMTAVALKGQSPVMLSAETLVNGSPAGSVEGVGKVLYNPSLPWLFAFEWTSFLLLVAVIGAVVLAGKRQQSTEGKA